MQPSTPRPPAKWLVATTDKGRDVKPFWTSTTSKAWSARLPSFTRSREWRPVHRDQWHASLSTTMSGAWWSVNMTRLEQPLAAPSLRGTMDTALQRVEAHDFGEAMPEQPWVKEQKVIEKRVKRKAAMRQAQKAKAEANKKKKNNNKGKRKRDLQINDAAAKVEGSFEGKVKLVRIFPAREQKDLIKRWIGTCRWTYNTANAAVKEEKCQPTMAPSLRHYCVNQSGLEELERQAKLAKTAGAPRKKAEDLSWVLETPADVRDRAVCELVQAYKTATKQHGKGNFSVEFRSAKRAAQQESITIGSRDWGRKSGVYAEIFAKDKLRTGKGNELPERMEHEFKVEFGPSSASSLLPCRWPSK